jgi:DNA integrity scanning protein DisA with diadenylate cyclase activity
MAPLVAAESITTDELVSVEQIKALQKRYLLLYDLVEGRSSERPDTMQIVDELFTVDGEWTAVFSDGRKETHRGREQLIAMLEGVARRHIDDPGHVVKHLGYNPQIEVHGNEATLKAQFVVLHAFQRNDQGAWVVGSYDDRLERDAQGKWRFKSKTVHVEDITFWRTSGPDGAD